jgi:hypothetical protein
MFKDFGQKTKLFHGFPNLNFQMNNEAYGFSGCTFWLDAAYGLNTQTDLAAVSSWKDKIKNISFEQATAANQPRLVTADANFNSLPCIDFHTNARYMISSSGLGIGNIFTLAFVFKINTGINRNILLTRDNTATFNPQLLLGGTAATITGTGFYASATGLIISTTEDTNPHICIITNNKVFIDGVEEGTGSVILLPVEYNYMGTTNTSNTIFSKIAELLKFDYTLTDDECIQLSTRLNSKYAIY